MKNYQRRTRGVTLIEVMLVMSIGFVMLYLSVQQYLSFRKDADVMQVQQNLNLISQAAVLYAKANCQPNGPLDPNPGSSYSPHPSTTYSLDIATDLINKGYLTQVISSNPLLSNVSATSPKGTPTVSSYNGYTAQLILTTVPRMQCTSANCATSTQIGSVAVWNVQVTAKLASGTGASTYQAILGATCTSSRNSANALVTCSTAQSWASSCLSYLAAYNSSPVGSKPNNTALKNLTNNKCNMDANSYNNYLVFDRTQSSAMQDAPQGQSNVGSANNNMQQFNQMYTTYPITYLLSSPTPTQYFYCGG